ncbi:hypothetical protein Tco_1185906 [Tanacetum coccineum]
MSSITTQQTKLDLELVPNENRFDIGKCNGRIPRGFSPRKPTFKFTLDAIALTPCYPAFLITADVPEMHQPWRAFAPLINRSLLRKSSGLDKLRLSRAQIIRGGGNRPKISRKFKKASPTKKDSDLLPVDEEPMRKLGRDHSDCKEVVQGEGAGC